MNSLSDIVRNETYTHPSTASNHDEMDEPELPPNHRFTPEFKEANSVDVVHPTVTPFSPHPRITTAKRFGGANNLARSNSALGKGMDVHSDYGCYQQEFPYAELRPVPNSDPPLHGNGGFRKKPPGSSALSRESTLNPQPRARGRPALQTDNVVEEPAYDDEEEESSDHAPEDKHRYQGGRSHDDSGPSSPTKRNAHDDESAKEQTSKRRKRAPLEDPKEDSLPY